jgi:thiol-disulfide isomerase/thioredoxin
MAGKDQMRPGLGASPKWRQVGFFPRQTPVTFLAKHFGQARKLGKMASWGDAARNKGLLHRGELVRLASIIPMTTFWFAFLAYAASWTFPTGPAEPTKGGGIAFPMTAEAYRGFSEKMASNAKMVTVKRLPPNLSPGARFGYNFVVSGVNRGWILDGGNERGWVLYLDWKGDGDLFAAEPLHFQKVDGQYRLEIEASDGEARWPVRFAVTHVKVEGEDKLGVEIGTGTIRRGVIKIDGKQARFALSGNRGRYNDPYSAITIEAPGAAPQRYRISEKRFNLFGKTFEFTVDSLGRHLALTEIAKVQPERASLEIGSRAPRFDGLTKLRGKMVLLEFWSTSCGPCRIDAPKNVAFYKTAPRDNIEFIGISSDESAGTLTDFQKKFGMTWPQIREPFEGPIHRLYRVDGEPTYYLIDPNGEIVDKWIGGGMTVERLTKALRR